MKTLQPPALLLVASVVVLCVLMPSVAVAATRARQDPPPVAGTTVRVSTDSSGAQTNGDIDWGLWIHVSISADGRYVAFSSDASNLVPADTNNERDVFVKDTTTGATVRVSTDSSGAQTNGDSGWGPISISADGRYVAFESWASNLVPGDTNGYDMKAT